MKSPRYKARNNQQQNVWPALYIPDRVESFEVTKSSPRRQFLARSLFIEPLETIQKPLQTSPMLSYQTVTRATISNPFVSTPYRFSSQDSTQRKMDSAGIPKINKTNTTKTFHKSFSRKHQITNNQTFKYVAWETRKVLSDAPGRA